MNRACVLVAVGVLSGPCLADVAYDRLSDFTAPPTQAFTAVPFHAEDVTLDNPGGEALTGVDLLCRLRSGSTLTNFEGTLHLRLFGSTPGTNSPLVGEEFYASSTPINLQRGVDSVISFALPEVAAPGQTIYVGWYFERTGGSLQWYNDVWVRQNAAPESAGSTTTFIAASNSPSPPYFYSNYPDRGYAIRVHTVPGPAAAAALLCGVCVTAVRRRR